jgi:integrase
MGTRFLASLSAKLNINSLRHIKAIARDLFEYAINPEGRIKSNPWDAVRLPRDAMRAKATAAYTQAEYDAIIHALKDRLDCQLIFAIACYCGLRKGEIEGLKWEHFDRDGVALHIQQSVSRGVIGLPKTESSIAPVIVPPQVKMFLHAWWEKKGKPTEGWLFPNNHLGTRPIDLHHLGYLTIKPILSEAGLKWMNWHACRHTCTTWLNAKGNAKLAQMQMRHASMSTTLKEYDEKITLEAHRNGILETFSAPKLLTK